MINWHQLHATKRDDHNTCTCLTCFHFGEEVNRSIKSMPIKPNEERRQGGHEVLTRTPTHKHANAHLRSTNGHPHSTSPAFHGNAQSSHSQTCRPADLSIKFLFLFGLPYIQFHPNLNKLSYEKGVDKWSNISTQKWTCTEPKTGDPVSPS